jgi:sodium/hydrogen antiporter
MHTDTAFALTVVALCYAVVSGLMKRWYVAPALIFGLVGVVLGPSGFDVIKLHTGAQAFTILAQLALTIILFNQASVLHPRTMVRRGHLTLRLLAIGIPITIGLGTLTALVVLPVLPVWEAVCLAVVVSPTEVALIEALTEEPRIPDQIRHALSAESGLYDGFALGVLFAAVALASEQSDPAPARWAWFAFRTEVISVMVGGALGLLGALVISRTNSRGWMSDTWAQLATLALALVCFGVGERFHASGFVTAFAGGVTYAMVSATDDEDPLKTQVSDAAGQLLELLVFAVFGAVVVIPAWKGVGWRVLLFSAVAMIVVRVAAVAVASTRSGLPPRQRLFIGWFGPRGIGTLVLGLLVIDRGEIHQRPLIAQAVVVTVTMSLVVHGITAPLGIRLCFKGIRPRASTRSDDLSQPDRPHGPGEHGRTAQA